MLHLRWWPELAVIGVVFFGALHRGLAGAFELGLGGPAETLAVSTRHLSFVETARSRPSPEMVLHLADQLEVPLRERNQLLLAAGYAPHYRARGLEEDPEPAHVRDPIGRVLAGHEPSPAIAVDRGWNLVMSNAALDPLREGVARAADAARRLPAGVPTLRRARAATPQPRRVARPLLRRLSRELQLTGDPALTELGEALLGYPGPVSDTTPDAGAIMVELHLAGGGRR